MPYKNSFTICSCVISSMIVVMYFPRYNLNIFKELFSNVFTFSKILLDDNLLNQFSGDNWELFCKSVACLVSIWPTVAHMFMGIFDASFILRPHLPTFSLLSTVLIMSVFMRHLSGGAGSKIKFDQRYYIGFPGCVTEKNFTLFSKLG